MSHPFQAGRNVSPRVRARVMSKSKGLRGTEEPASVAQKWAASRRPAYAATILKPMPCALPLFPPRSNARKIRPGPSSPGRQRVRTPEAGPLAGRRWLGLAICLGPLMSAGTSGAATLVPRSRRSAARVLMDEGWVHSNAAKTGGDKFCPLSARSRHLAPSRLPCTAASASASAARTTPGPAG